MPTLTYQILQLAGPIEPISQPWHQHAQAHLDTLTKPLGSLGRLEDLAAQYVAIRRERYTDPIRKAVYVFAADHGVTAENVSAYSSAVTHQMVLNFLAGGAAINVLARQQQASLTIIDAGVATDFAGAAGLIHRKVAHGTANMRREAAMTEQQLFQAIAIGTEMADHAAVSGANLIALGEMGIGNTTAAAAITCALTGSPVAEATGRGTGLSSTSHKAEVIQQTLALHHASEPAEILRRMGGFEIAAMTGMILRLAHLQLPILIDGFIASSAAALAAALVPETTGYMIAGHRSQEPGHVFLLNYLALKPLLQLELRLGEGTGAVLAMSLVESAMALYREMATFTSAGVSQSEGSPA